MGPLFYGLMTEEINHSYDGGLYAELIQNRIFQDAKDPSDGLSCLKKPMTANPIPSPSIRQNPSTTPR